MFKIARFFKKHVVALVAIVVFLFIQAMSQLALPNYMSEIINNGISGKGVEESVPLIMSEDYFDALNKLLPKEEQDILSKSYELTDPTDSNYNSETNKFPGLTRDAYYYQVEKIDNPVKINEAMLIIYGLPKLPPYENVPNILEIINNFTPEQVSAITTEFSSKFKDAETLLIEQMAKLAVEEQYTSYGVNLDDLQLRYIIKVGFMMLMVTLISAVAAIIVGYLSSVVAAGVARKMRSELFEKVTNFSNNELDKFSIASLITRTTNDVSRVQQTLVMILQLMLYAPMMGIGGIIMSYRTQASLTWTIALGVGGVALLIVVIYIFVVPKFRVIQKYIDRLNLVSRERLNGMLVIRAFTNEKLEEGRFTEANKELMDINLYVNRAMKIMQPMMMLFMNVVILVIVWFSADYINAGNMQVGNMMAFMQYSMQVMFSFLMLSMMFINIPRAAVCAGRIMEVLDTPFSIKNKPNAEELTEVKEGVEFKNVTFAYPGAEKATLSNINFSCKRGERLAIIGSTGSGKSTILSLIPRFYDTCEGEVLIDGKNVEDLTLNSLRSQLGYVPQKSLLFTGTIAENIAFSDNELKEEDLNLAASVAQAADFIEAKPLGMEEPIAQGGGNVSGGQKQRLSIARALANKAPILLFDDSFSALDFKTDAMLRSALHDNYGNSAIIIVAQRVASIMDADKIIVLENGEIVGSGTHKELLANCEVYQEIAKSQLSQEELADE